MPDFVLNGTSTLARTLDNLEHGVIGPIGLLAVADGDAITASFASKLSVFGALSADSFGSSRNAVDFDGSSFRLFVGEAGTVTADGNAVNADTSARVVVTNHGMIASNNDALRIVNSDGHAVIEVSNHGVISGIEDGMLLHAGSSATDILNSGRISGNDAAISISPFAEQTGTVRLVNSGEIVSTSGPAYAGNAGPDMITNAGLISGDVELGQGDDVYDGASGRLTGQLAAGAGADMLTGGDHGDRLRGGPGTDDIRGGGGDDVLNGSEGADSVAGGAGDDSVRGSKGGDTLRGNRGDDRLRGDGGADLIAGGRGDDIASGGKGADTFVFGRLADEDVITDFEDGRDVIDLTAFGLRPAQFGARVEPALANAGGGATLIDLAALGGQGSVLVEGLRFADAGAGDFIL